jgi:HEPN domain-containing protein
MKVRPDFSPLDINIQFIIEEGWSHADRLRFHPETKIETDKDRPLTAILTNLKPYMLFRRYDREEDSFLTVFISQEGEIEILSNDRNFAQRYLNGLFLECPPSFHSAEELEIVDEWIDDQQVCAMFIGLLHGALGWDPSHQIPPAIRASLEEAEKSISIANYRSCVVMCRRTVEALLKFAFFRLLGSKAIDNKGKTLTLNAMIEEFKKRKTSSIPAHLLHVLDSVRVIGNVPGAHAAEIEGYQFSKSDAEFALASVHYFVEQYFSKIDTEVLEYYTLTIDLNEKS